MNITWVLKPSDTPLILRNCGRCGRKREFTCSHRFRINAQQRRLDVWLIYHCVECGCTWNLEILARVRPEDIKRELYDGFLRNDIGLAYQYAFNAGILSGNKAEACHDRIEYAIEGDVPSIALLMQEEVTVRISNPFKLQTRLDRLMQEKTGIPRSVWKNYFEGNAQQDGGSHKKSNPKLKGDITLAFEPAKMRELLQEGYFSQKEIFLSAEGKT